MHNVYVHIEHRICITMYTYIPVYNILYIVYVYIKGYFFNDVKPYAC